MYQFQLYELVA